MLIISTTAGLIINRYIADIIRSRSGANSCHMTNGTDTAGRHVEGYAYGASTTNSHCDTTAHTKAILSAVK